MSSVLTARLLAVSTRPAAGSLARSGVLGQRSTPSALRCLSSSTGGHNRGQVCRPSQPPSRKCAPISKQADQVRGLAGLSANMASITAASLTDDMLTTTWQDGSHDQFPLPWLRDNCQCDACFHAPSIQRLFLIRNLRLDAKVTELKVTDGGVRLEWDDGHVSLFAPDWLRDRRFSAECSSALQPWMELKPRLWLRKDMQENVPTDTMHNLLTDDEALYRWLCHLEQDGVFLIRDAPQQEGELHKLGQRVAFLKKTNYGETFTVKAKVDASNLAFTTASLGLHTDLPYYRYAPGMQMLHCINQVKTEGGENQLVDAFKIADMMRHEHPDHFRLLSTLPVQFFDIGVDYYPYHKQFTVPVFSLNHNGEVVRVAYNNQVRDSFMPYTSAETVRHFYHAIKLFDDLMFTKENHIDLKMRDGDIICFHNYRVMHGRTGYRPLGGGVRHLQGGYIDWDELQSRRRVLQRQLHPAETNSTMFPKHTTANE